MKKEFTDYEKITNKVGIKHYLSFQIVFLKEHEKKENLIKDIKEKYTSEDLELLLQMLRKLMRKWIKIHQLRRSTINKFLLLRKIRDD